MDRQQIRNADETRAMTVFTVDPVREHNCNLNLKESRRITTTTDIFHIPLYCSETIYKMLSTGAEELPCWT